MPIVTLIARPIQAAMLKASPTNNRPVRDTLTTAAKGRMSHARTQASQAVGDALATKQSGASAREPSERASRGRDEGLVARELDGMSPGIGMHQLPDLVVEARQMIHTTLRTETRPSLVLAHCSLAALP